DVAARTLLHRRLHVHLDEGPELLDHRARLAPRLLVGRDRGRDDGAAVARQARGDPADPLDVRVAILLRDTQSLRKMGANRGAVGRVQGMQPIERYPVSCSGLNGISLTWM